jgi:hypothetical protein
MESGFDGIKPMVQVAKHPGTTGSSIIQMINQGLLEIAFHEQNHMK